jgi:hypothetical protein
MAKHKIIDPKDKHIGKPDLSKTMNVSELKEAVKWLFEYLRVSAK